VTTEITSSSGIAPLIFQYRANTPVWSNAMVIHNGTTTPGYVGIGTMAPLFNLHVYQLSNTNPATMTVQMSNTGQSSQLYLSNASGTTTQLYLNGPNLSADGPVNSATLRNNAGDLRLAAQGTTPYIYLQTSTSNVGINTTTATQSLDVSGYARIGSGSSDTARLILGRAPGTTNFDYASMIESVSTFATNYQSTLRFYTHGTATTGANPTLAMTINPTQQVGIGIAPLYKFHVDNTSTSGINAVVQASTIVAGNTTSMILGKALSTNNSATFVWNHVGEGLATNYLGIGYYGGDNKLCVTASGTVGIGTTSPGYLLDVNGTIATRTDIRFNGTGLNAADKKLYSPADGDLEWMTNTGAGVRGFAVSHQGTKIVYLNANGNSYLNGGNIGIGTTNPIRTFHLNGGEFSFTPSSTTAYLNISDSAGNSGGNYTLIIRGLGSAGAAQVGIASFSVVATASTFSGTLSSGEITTTGSLNMTGNSTRIKFNSTSSWSGDAGTSFGKLEYHAERWYINAGSNSDRIVQFRRAGTDVSYVDNSGTYVGNGLSGGAVSATTGTFSSTVSLTEANANLGLNRGAVWFNSNGDTNHYLYNNYNNRDGAGGFDGMKWNAYDGLWVRGGASGANTGLFVNASGNVGIGTTGVNGRMNIYQATGSTAGATSGTLTLDHGNNYGSSSIVFPSRINYGSDYGYIQYNDTRGGAGETANMIIGTSNDGDDHVSLMPSGNVGINTLTPGYKLEIQGNDYASGGRYTSNFFRVYGTGGIYWEDYGGGWYMSDGTYLRSYNDKTIYSGGQIAAGGDIIAYFSDMRLKKNVEPITNALDKIKTLSTFTYEVNEVGASYGLEEHIRNSGFSAQEVQKIMPEVIRLAPFDMGEKNEVTGVTESKSGENYMTLLYDKMAPLIVAALKEEVQKREDLEKEVAELKQLVQNLLARQ
jgi:hypothetical protein